MSFSRKVTSKYAIVSMSADHLYSLAKQYESSVYNGSADDYKWKYVANFPIKEILKRDVERTDRRSGWDHDQWVEWGKKNNKTTDKASLLSALKTPIVMVDDGYDIYIWDGHHRIAGCLISSLDHIPAVVGIPLE
jgi:hypothetical protein